MKNFLRLAIGSSLLVGSTMMIAPQQADGFSTIGGNLSTMALNCLCGKLALSGTRVTTAMAVVTLPKASSALVLLTSAMSGTAMQVASALATTTSSLR